MKNLDVRVKISEIPYSIRKLDRKMGWGEGRHVMCTGQMLVRHSEYKSWLKSIYALPRNDICCCDDNAHSCFFHIDVCAGAVLFCFRCSLFCVLHKCVSLLDSSNRIAFDMFAILIFFAARQRFHPRLHFFLNLVPLPLTTTATPHSLLSFKY